MGILSIGTFLSPPTWSHEQNGDCPPGVLEDPYFLDLGFGHWAFCPWGFCRVELLSIGAFLCPSRDQMYSMRIVHTCITYMITWTDGGLSALSVIGSLFSVFWLLSVGLLSILAFVHFGFCQLGLFSAPSVITWIEWGLSTPVSPELFLL